MFILCIFVAFKRTFVVKKHVSKKKIFVVEKNPDHKYLPFFYPPTPPLLHQTFFPTNPPIHFPTNPPTLFSSTSSFVIMAYWDAREERESNFWLADQEDDEESCSCSDSDCDCESEADQEELPPTSTAPIAHPTTGGKYPSKHPLLAGKGLLHRDDEEEETRRVPGPDVICEAFVVNRKARCQNKAKKYNEDSYAVCLKHFNERRDGKPVCFDEMDLDEYHSGSGYCPYHKQDHTGAFVRCRRRMAEGPCSPHLDLYAKLYRWCTASERVKELVEPTTPQKAEVFYRLCAMMEGKFKTPCTFVHHDTGLPCGKEASKEMCGKHRKLCNKVAKKAKEQGVSDSFVKPSSVEEAREFHKLAAFLDGEGRPCVFFSEGRVCGQPVKSGRLCTNHKRHFTTISNRISKVDSSVALSVPVDEETSQVFVEFAERVSSRSRSSSLSSSPKRRRSSDDPEVESLGLSSPMKRMHVSPSAKDSKRLRKLTRKNKLLQEQVLSLQKQIGEMSEKLGGMYYMVKQFISKANSD